MTAHGSPTDSSLAPSARRAALAMLLGLALVAPGCHALRFEVADGPRAEEVLHRKSFFVFGLFPRQMRVDLSRFCPDGVAAVREQTTFEDGLIAVLTASLWTPRSSWYACVSESGEAPEPVWAPQEPAKGS